MLPSSLKACTCALLANSWQLTFSHVGRHGQALAKGASRLLSCGNCAFVGLLDLSRLKPADSNFMVVVGAAESRNQAAAWSRRTSLMVF